MRRWAGGKRYSMLCRICQPPRKEPPMTDPKTIPQEANDDTSNDPEMQGEGNYTAARRHRESVEQFVESGQVGAAADAAEPGSSEEAQALRDAEEIGRSKAKT
jgi:hypothetical protein